MTHQTRGLEAHAASATQTPTISHIYLLVNLLLMQNAQARAQAKLGEDLARVMEQNTRNLDAQAVSVYTNVKMGRNKS